MFLSYIFVLLLRKVQDDCMIGFFPLAILARTDTQEMECYYNESATLIVIRDYIKG